MSRSFATQSSVSPRRSVIPKHNAREASQGYLPASCSELVAVLADYLLWRFGKDGIAAVEHQAKALQVLELESILSYQNSRRELGQIPTALKIRFRGTKGHPLEPQSSSEIDPNRSSVSKPTRRGGCPTALQLRGGCQLRTVPLSSFLLIPFYCLDWTPIDKQKGRRPRERRTL